MKKNELFRDWEFRYRYIYRKRRTKKSKQRFLSALVSDIYSMRTDVTVTAYDTLAYRSKKYLCWRYRKSRESYLYLLRYTRSCIRKLFHV